MSTRLRTLRLYYGIPSGPIRATFQTETGLNFNYRWSAFENLICGVNHREEVDMEKGHHGG